MRNRTYCHGNTVYVFVLSEYYFLVDIYMYRDTNLSAISQYWLINWPRQIIGLALIYRLNDQ